LCTITVQKKKKKLSSVLQLDGTYCANVVPCMGGGVSNTEKKARVKLLFTAWGRAPNCAQTVWGEIGQERTKLMYTCAEASAYDQTTRKEAGKK
jgi:hypothetical protein